MDDNDIQLSKLQKKNEIDAIIRRKRELDHTSAARTVNV